MSDHHSDHKTDAIASSVSETAALPHVEAPAISPATVLEAVPNEAAPVDVAPVEVGVTPPAAESSAMQRFRAAAAEQMAAARQRLEQRNTSSMMAVVLIASLAGGFGTVLASSAIAHFTAPADQRAEQTRTLDDAMARIEDEIAALRGKFERTAELNAAQAHKTGERFERIEKAQAEPAARLSKLAETVEKLRVANAAQAPSVQAASAASNDITGSVKPAPTSAKPQPAKPAIVEGWTLREVDRDAALIEGKRGLIETYVGDTIPGVGRVEGFRKQDGRWVVVTAKGLIVSR